MLRVRFRLNQPMSSERPLISIEYVILPISIFFFEEQDIIPKIYKENYLKPTTNEQKFWPIFHREKEAPFYHKPLQRYAT